MKKKFVVLPLFIAVLMLSFLIGFASPAAADVGIGISVRFGPPALPVYAQPMCPGPGYFWTPGYWAWDDDYGYYWVPGTWVVAPVGMLWTPGYWGWNEGLYFWHPGYWGPHVGFYGGVNYGFGYTGVGFYGGEWRGRNFYYNRSVTNVNIVNVTNVYNKTVIVNNTTVNRVSYNGGPGGIGMRPTRQELVAEREPHRFALPVQTEHEHMASRDRQLFASENHGRPAIAATMRPAVFTGHDVVAARAAGAAYHAPAMSPREARGPAMNTNRPGNSNTPNARNNSGFQKFGQPNNAGNNNRPGNDRNANWNNAPRPGNAPNRSQQANPNGGYQRSGPPANNDRNMVNNRTPANNDQNWRSNRPNGNVSRPAGNMNRQPGASPNPARPSRTMNDAQVQNRPQPQHQNPPRANTPQQVNPPRSNSPHQANPPEQRDHPVREPAREPARGPGRGR